ncbi:MAG: nucleoside phosphorylase [Waddliaceae bacterium]|jgi:uridine phosphorylase|nr:nucleoside phosphorylase [Waddliaceae bacterium]MBT3578754.1 nucleoside phosphorylase [Waddliaceae bacterium]MBT4445062.1 nucleoside phosphorylase [Waddliaceae bacterium]MBT6929085.1 nucleoside phosphorylase [Waddliaceae bacterium]MBT7264371.1 nucleoside phosphorylase [Waddliaceae bacterium]
MKKILFVIFTIFTSYACAEAEIGIVDSKEETMIADKPVLEDGRQYHLHTAPNDLARHCILVGSPERAELIATEFFTDSKEVGSNRGLKSFTGKYKGMPISVVTTGMGSASTGVVLPEAVRSGAGVFIRVGSCGVLQPGYDCGSALISSAACRYDGASDNWAPIEWPAVADWRVVAALKQASENMGKDCPVGISVTTTCFNEGQARPDDDGYIPPRLLEQHNELVQRGALFYSMEEATIFVWCSTHGNFPCSSIDTVYANRINNTFQAGNDQETAEIALEAMLLLKEL